ncbi:Sorting and assembly machinery subunit 50kDa subunit SAM50 [Carpediemonas membranifera]|uniref:Sorting and assembly machinery subunit 50kDa subunit SAM50 n=1 Tax=Carpediemonas membranifera TaxID=201153 RepID=A0A8J6BZM4_9EUKA|nr:Sorting and assembly machinery subunit 50kDa subunit SAM50 [Carpediemonas membranifera]|eukprot:KAG9395676.1 Sorting and assembly machinery subunit 50kDa subunit SAM50 [Carpediemonas membranifera]
MMDRRDRLVQNEMLDVLSRMYGSENDIALLRIILAERFSALPGVRRADVAFNRTEGENGATISYNAVPNLTNTDWRNLRLFVGLTSGKPIGEISGAVLNKLPGFMHAKGSSTWSKPIRGPTTTKYSAFISDIGLFNSLRNAWTVGTDKTDSEEEQASHNHACTTAYAEVVRTGPTTGIYDILAAPSTFAIAPPRRMFTSWFGVLRAFWSTREISKVTITASEAIKSLEPRDNKAGLAMGLFKNNMKFSHGRPVKGFQASASAEAAMVKPKARAPPVPQGRVEAALSLTNPLGPWSWAPALTTGVSAGVLRARSSDSGSKDASFHDRFHLGGGALRHFQAKKVGPCEPRSPMCPEAPVSVGVDWLGGDTYWNSYVGANVPMPIHRLADIPKVGRFLQAAQGLKDVIFAHVYGNAGGLTLGKDPRALIKDIRCSVGAGVLVRTGGGLMEIGLGVPLCFQPFDVTQGLVFGVGLEL